MPRVATKQKPEATSDAPKSNRRGSVPPVQIRKMTESAEQHIGQVPVREFDQYNELTKLGFQAEGGKRQKRQRGEKWMQDMAFANEMVTVRIHESTDKLAHPFPEVSVNGRVQRFVRGHEIQVRRCYVERLARMKLTTYGSVKTKDVDGEDVYRYPSTTGLVYDFSVVSDTPKGHAWLKQVLAEPG